MWVVTWNVLHRIHAENWREVIPDRFPDEADRIAHVTARIARRLAVDDAVVVCLQEVSGDQLESFEHLPGVDVVAFRYPRMPTLRGGGPCPLRAPEEFLVTIAWRARLVEAAAWPTDPGKGFLAVEVDLGGDVDGRVRSVTIVNTHLSGGDRRDAQLTGLAGIAGHGDRVVVCGDFNSGLDVVAGGIGPGFVAADLGADALPTRPRSASADGTVSKPPAIDHILARGLRLSPGRVVDVDGESDHNLVEARADDVPVA